MRVGVLHAGPEHQGIRRYSRILASALREHTPLEIIEVAIRNPTAPAIEAAARRLSACDVVHVQVCCQAERVVFSPSQPDDLDAVSVFLTSVTAPLVSTLHDVATAASKDIQTPLSRLADRCKLLIVFTAVDERQIQPFIPQARISIVPHFVEERRHVADRGEAKQMLGLNGTVLTIIGHIYRRKGYHVFLEAFQQLPETCTAVFAGAPAKAGRSQHYLQSLLKTARKNGFEHRLRMTGYLPEDLLDYYIAATDIAICPFLNSAASSSISSWISADKWIIASDLPALRTYDDIATGAIEFCMPKQPGALQAAIDQMISSGMILNTNKSAERIKEVLSSQVIAANHQRIFMEAANQ